MSDREPVPELRQSWRALRKRKNYLDNRINDEQLPRAAKGYWRAERRALVIAIECIERQFAEQYGRSLNVAEGELASEVVRVEASNA